MQWTAWKIFHSHSRKNWRRKFEKMNVIIHIVKLGRSKTLSLFQSKVENWSPTKSNQMRRRSWRGQPLIATADGASGCCPRGPGLESLLSIRGLKIKEMNFEFNATLFIDTFPCYNGCTILPLAFLNL